ncbi:MAG: hypothetical protein H6684_11105 [Deltaproteobacteria bacterium]|nr:hypothetical protein [Deltaproteobacteria bacterium]MCB9489270.1 hypothetical protein [Deltaproteobacteria bacterium]
MRLDIFRRIGVLTFQFALVAAVALSVTTCGSGDDDDDEKCPRFSDQQLYPASGGPDTQFELLVILKDTSENNGIDRIIAQLKNSEGSNTGKTFTLVRSDADPRRYLRSESGEDLCDEGVCNLYFRVIAEHDSGCKKAFETDVIQVVNPEGATDDDDDATDDDTSADDDDDDDDDTSLDDDTA